MRWIAVVALALILGSGLAGAAEPAFVPVVLLMPSEDGGTMTAAQAGPSVFDAVLVADGTGRGPFESDHAFDGFIGPITNPVLAKDPRTLTEARLLFVQNHVPAANPLGGDFQIYAMQLRLALTERLSFIADKDGYAVVRPRGGPSMDGWLNVAFGLKYLFVRDPEQQLLVSGGVMYEPQTGEADAFQNQGKGLFTVFGTVGKEFGECNHVLFNAGYQFPVDKSQNSSLLYASVHVDRQMFGWLYPLVEVNWFHYTQGGDRGLPPALGEGDGLLNLGTSGISGHDIVSGAVGLKAHLCPNIDVGAAYEIPFTSRRDLLGNRVTAEIILRY